nr:hypothetical protein [Acidobacteriota bacterium]
ASMTLLAFALLNRPAWAGVALVAAAGVGFYPIFMTPAWVGFYWRDRRALASFLAACTVASVLLLTFVYQTSRPHGDQSRLQTFVSDTLGHHTDPDGYGRSPFGFWGQQTGWRAWLQEPLAGSSPMASPLWLAFFALLLLAGLVTPGRDPAALALVLGAVALGATLVKPHATGTYLTWYYGLLLLGFGLPRFTWGHKKL